MTEKKKVMEVRFNPSNDRYRIEKFRNECQVKIAHHVLGVGEHLKKSELETLMEFGDFDEVIVHAHKQL